MSRMFATKVLIVMAMTAATLGASPAARADDLPQVPADADNVYECTFVDALMHDMSSNGLSSVDSVSGQSFWSNTNGSWAGGSGSGFFGIPAVCVMQDRNAGQPDDDGDDDTGLFSNVSLYMSWQVPLAEQPITSLCAGLVLLPSAHMDLWTPEGLVGIYGWGAVTAQAAAIDWSSWWPDYYGGYFAGTIQPATSSGTHPFACVVGSHSGTSGSGSHIDFVSLSGKLVAWSYDN